MIYRLLSPGAFLLALACFILPFTRVSCSGKDGKEIVIKEAKGWEMAFGHKMEEQDSLKQQQQKLETLADMPQEMTSDKSVKLQPLVLISFILTALALVLCFFLRGKLMTIPGALGIVAFGLMIGYMVHVNSQVKTDPMAGTMFSEIKFKVKYLAAFWASCIFMLAGGLLCFSAARQFMIKASSEAPVDTDILV